MKKLLTMVLALAVALSLCASALAAGPVEFWNDNKVADDETGIQWMNGWSAAYGDTVENVIYPDTASYQTAISQSIDTPSAAPEIFTWWSGSQLESLAANGKVLALDELWEKVVEAGVAPSIKDAFTMDGSAYAVPFSVLYNTCIYNTAAFEKAGIEAVPATFDEFIEDCDKLLAAGITPISLKNDSWASFIWFEAMVAACDPELYKGICDGSIPYTDERMVEVLNIWGDMFQKGYFATPAGYDDHTRRFATGKCAICIEPQTHATKVFTDYGVDTISAFVLPSMKGDKNVVFMEAAPMCIPAVCDNVEAAEEAILAYYSPEMQAVTAEASGIILIGGVECSNAAVKTIAELPQDTEANTVILRYYENTPSEIRDVALDVLARFMDGQADVETTLSTIQAKADEVFGK